LVKLVAQVASALAEPVLTPLGVIVFSSKQTPEGVFTGSAEAEATCNLWLSLLSFKYIIIPDVNF
jgi:hypothetical protein